MAGKPHNPEVVLAGQKRIQEEVLTGHITLLDLSKELNVPYETMRGWKKKLKTSKTQVPKSKPISYEGDLLTIKLALDEQAIAVKNPDDLPLSDKRLSRLQTFSETHEPGVVIPRKVLEVIQKELIDSELVFMTDEEMRNHVGVRDRHQWKLYAKENVLFESCKVSVPGSELYWTDPAYQQEVLSRVVRRG